MNFKERVRVISERLLDMAGFPSSPRNQAPYRFSNDLQRTLAHLAATDGDHSRLLQALASGVLRVQAEGSEGVPFHQSAAGTVSVRVSEYGGRIAITFPDGCIVATPLWAGVLADLSVKMVESTADEYNLVTASFKMIEVNVGYGGTDPNITVGGRVTSGSADIPQWELPKGAVIRGFLAHQYFYIASTTGDAEVYLRKWE